MWSLVIKHVYVWVQNNSLDWKWANINWKATILSPVKIPHATEFLAQERVDLDRVFMKIGLCGN